MNNRLKEYFELPEPRSDFWRIVTEWGWVYVDEETAHRILVRIERRFGRRWIRFYDLFGARVSLRTRDIMSVDESTSAAREMGRLFQKALRDEVPDDRPWEDC